MSRVTERVADQSPLAIRRIDHFPVIVLMPHSRCNCRCVMCDIWKANRIGRELSAGDLAPHINDFRRLGVRWVALSGGEALLHRNLWELCAMLKELPARISLLSSGLLLDRFAAEVVHWCDDVVVSLDGSRRVHDAIRRVPRAYERLRTGIAALKTARPAYRVTARCVVQRANYAELPQIISAAHELAIDQISFVAADVSTEAFNRARAWPAERVAEIALDMDQVVEFRGIVEAVIRDRRADFESRFIAESPDKLRRLPEYFAALHGLAEFSTRVCNAPWVSAVIEADGAVRPCFFHPPLGNLHQEPLDAILNGVAAEAFRQQLDVTRDPICRKCVCTLHIPPGDIGPPGQG
jgi:MoaA/NifB/PqqE/SkfB family radical SAM enzyme